MRKRQERLIARRTSSKVRGVRPETAHTSCQTTPSSDEEEEEDDDDDDESDDDEASVDVQCWIRRKRRCSNKSALGELPDALIQNYNVNVDYDMTRRRIMTPPGQNMTVQTTALCSAVGATNSFRGDCQLCTDPYCIEHKFEYYD